MIVAYLDNNATTRLLPEAFEAMRPYLTDRFLNPASAAAVARGDPDPASDARRALAALLGDPDLHRDIVLTSGASEANSWVVQAACPGEGHIVLSAIEHPSLIAAAEAAERRGAQVDYVGCGQDGRVDAADILKVVRPDTALVSVMFANNETGVLQPVAEIAAEARRRAPDVLIHTDATQAVGRVALDLVGDLADVDLLSLSAHKFHGPRGVGALFVREGIELAPLIHGRQDDGRRGGTSNSAAAAGLAVAAQHAMRGINDWATMVDLRSRLEAGLYSIHSGSWTNGRSVPRLPNTLSMTLPGLSAEDVVDQLALQGICIASGSACDSGSMAPSHVLSAMGLSYEDAKSTLRFSLSSWTTAMEIDIVLSAMRSTVLP
ncbi:Cysteine desulfurase NifS [Brevundimonas sp. NIBR10]|uniref:cysteine desulfurase family protein n=1 Tax=Brevundimonas sp. NIBR10 TaxID=3015997 RepID=UPI0022F17EAB|nr:cysteine desulfurase family protein [Brevundimonas sp. NIBR10]WGM45842.1 Cysteine desulfurase NifS [Brevundimonas sp. NIBR10]